MKTTLGISAAALVASVGMTAFAQDSGPRALASAAGGQDAWANRSLVAKPMELQILSGPTSVQGLSITHPLFTGANTDFGINIRHFRDRYETPLGDLVYKDTMAAWPIGVSFGVIENLEVGMGLPLYLSPGDFGDLPLWVTYKFLDGNVQLGARFALFFPTHTEFQLQAGLPLMARVRNMRIDSGAFFHFAFYDNVYTSIHMPLRLGWQVTQELYAGLQTGLDFGLQSDFFTFRMPLMGFVGYTIPNKSRATIDVAFRFGFDQFIKAGDGVENGVDANDFSVAMGANFGIQF